MSILILHFLSKPFLSFIVGFIIGVLHVLFYFRKIKKNEIIWIIISPISFGIGWLLSFLINFRIFLMPNYHINTAMILYALLKGMLLLLLLKYSYIDSLLHNETRAKYHFSPTLFGAVFCIVATLYGISKVLYFNDPENPEETIGIFIAFCIIMYLIYGKTFKLFPHSIKSFEVKKNKVILL